MGDQRISADEELGNENDSEKKPHVGGSSPTPSLPVAPDGGWGWIVVLASFCISIVVDGICYTFGVIKSDLQEHFETSSSTTAWAGSILAGVYLIVGPIVSALANKFGCREVCITGSIIAGVFFVISSFSQDISMILITYGVMGGIGFGMMYLPAIVMVGYYFDKKRALATGLAVCGSGIGTFIMAPLATFLLQTFTWRGANIILGAIILNGIVFGALYRPIAVKTDESNCEKSFVMEKIAKDKRSRYYSTDQKEKEVDDQNDTAQNEEIDCRQTSEPLVSCDADKETFVRSRHTSRVDDDSDKHGRSRHVSKVSFASDTEKRPFDRQDALYPGNIMETKEFKDCGADLASYIQSVTSLHQAEDTKGASSKHLDRLNSVVSVITEMFDVSLLTSPTFVIVCLSGFLVFTGLFTPFVYGPAKAQFLGSSPEKASLLLSVLGACNTVSRVVTGFIADLPQVDCILVHNVAAILAGILTCLVCFFNSYELLMMYCALFGIFIAAFIALRSIVIVELLGIKKLTNAFGLLSLCQGIAVLIGSPITGAIYDKTKSFFISFLVSGVIITAGGLICLPMRAIARWEQRRQQTYDVVKASQTETTVAA